MRFAARDEKGSSHHADRLNETGKIAALLRRQLEDEDTDRKGHDTATCRGVDLKSSDSNGPVAEAEWDDGA